MQDDPIRVIDEQLLSDDHAPLKKVTFEQRRSDGAWQRQEREVYANAGGAAVLLFDRARRTVLLTRQFRMGAHLAGQDGFVIEAPAGMLDGTGPEQRVRAESCEETGYRAKQVRKVLAFMPNPSALTEIVHCFLGEYERGDKVAAGGGKAEEGEDIEVLEIDAGEAFAMARDGRIVDAKTIILLQRLQQEM
ncbi:NUDIX domain-containing protein [Massilia sp. G4R7]|uniref:GDP-mannose pyrophosphatase n=1 Tax=Massilia phyllostachyos TaxID=2898585 RepID=A0ABS8Q2T4_9BURK|nr:NUDIX domain-containing protein [Massilia phyllostachyos]MCD2516053.1 NUDIX domain-containing protein [Massilia phyllostachyos]